MGSRLGRPGSLVPVCAAWAAIAGTAVLAGVLVVLRDSDWSAVPLAVVGLGTTASVLIGRRRNRPPDPRPWTRIALGSGLFVLSAIARYALYGTRAAPVAELIAASGYVAMVAAFVAFLEARRAGARRLDELVDGLIVMASTGTLVVVVFTVPTALHAGRLSGSALMGLFPLADVVILFAVVLLSWTSARRVPAYRFLTAAVAGLLVGDVGYAPGHAGTTGRFAVAGPAVLPRLRGRGSRVPAPVDDRVERHAGPAGRRVVAPAVGDPRTCAPAPGGHRGLGGLTGIGPGRRRGWSHGDPAAADPGAGRGAGARPCPTGAPVPGHPRSADRLARSTPGDTVEDLLRDGDTAMYRAKADGRDRFVALDATMRAEMQLRTEIELALRGAAANGELFLVYQPVLCLDDGQIVGVEALIRWRHPTLGTIPPDRFIPVAEQTSLIVEVGAWVLDAACAQAAVWAALDPDRPPLHMAINVSARQLVRSSGLVELVDRTLRQRHLDPGTLVLEVTESALMEDAEAALGVLLDLKALGVRIAIDDFGTGYSSLAYLERFPVDLLKVDRSFVAGLGRNSGSLAIVRSVVELARAFGVDAVAEGVETPEHWALLGELGCRFGQGHLWSPGLRPAELVALVASSRLDAVAGRSALRHAVPSA